MDEIATVIEKFDNKIRVSIPAKEGCKRCGICKTLQDGFMYLEVENTIDAQPGDKVFIEIEPSNLKIAFIIYGIPCLLFIAGIFSGLFLFKSDMAGFASGLVFLVFSFFVIKLFNSRYSPKIKKY